MRRQRSTRTELLRRDEKQAAIVAELLVLGADKLAAQVTRCWHDRLLVYSGRRRFTCRSVTCYSCRRPPLAAWWRSILTWCHEGGATSYLRMPVGDPFIDLPVIAKSIRNLRDRLLRAESWLWGGTGFVGISDGQHLHILISHPGIARGQVQRRLSCLWPAVLLIDAPMMPLAALDTKILARLGARRRGYQPMRFQVLPHN